MRGGLGGTRDFLFFCLILDDFLILFVVFGLRCQREGLNWENYAFMFISFHGIVVGCFLSEGTGSGYIFVRY